VFRSVASYATVSRTMDGGELVVRICRTPCGSRSSPNIVRSWA